MKDARRRDWSFATPPFTMTDEEKVLVKKLSLRGYEEMTLAEIHQRHCCRHRPIIGLWGSLSKEGLSLFYRDWQIHRDQHMAEAWVYWRAQP